ncbi:hypothetical protein SJI45_01895 [Streptomyces sp. S399]|uniref:hypothetical protein n=1 Tax=Streptomyces sp. S399 TaxID=3096009 RepID=UPI002A8318B7|nr:hypothetical protein [Streptomyces sp. S399]WPR50033.1 hypothetical protein SJI45_01895 [Streptomyces sp. S399]
MPLLLATLGDELAGSDGSFTASWFLMPVAMFVEEHGLDPPGAAPRRHRGDHPPPHR